MEKASTKDNEVTPIRMGKLTQLGNQNCAKLCDGRWLESALQVLSWNMIDKFAFAVPVGDLLQNGRKKGLNIFLIGPSNCAKGFLLEPLEHIYICFVNPAKRKCLKRLAWFR